MEEIILFCKSYKKDATRAKLLATSIDRHNRDGIPFYLSVPAVEISFFGELLKGARVTLLADEDILEETARATGVEQSVLAALVPGIAQQLVKAEFWRLGLASNYLVIDSDSFFIREFRTGDFLHPDGFPYTVIHECKDLLQFAARSGMDRVKNEYEAERRTFMSLFGRIGKLYDFGPTPLLWSSLVWQWFEKEYCAWHTTDIVKLFSSYPCEILWYGECLLASQAIPLFPVEPLFKVYHYKKQFEEGIRLGENETKLAMNFFGIVKQSAWDRELDFGPGKTSLSRLKRLFGM